jgi:hypothetical protein
MVKFKVLKATGKKMAVFWDMLCSLAEIHQ